jgi:hypothetical protein
MTRTLLRAAWCAPALLAALALAACAGPATAVERDAASAASVDWSVGEFRSPWNVWSFDSANQDALTMCAGVVLPSDNAVFCPDDESVIWDEQLMRGAWAQGEGPLAVIVAHEWGHVVQLQAGFTGHWPAVELQADCLAGAALADLVASDARTWDDDELDRAEEALAEYGDPAPWTAPGDHGDGAERAEAFRLGVDGGVAACASDPHGRG